MVKKGFWLIHILFVLGACHVPIAEKVATIPQEAGKPVAFRKALITGIEYQGGGYVDGPLKDARFDYVSDMVFDKKGNFYVADAGNKVIRYVDLENDRVSTFAGTKYDVTENMSASATYRNGSLKEARFSSPVSLAMTSEGALYVADSGNHKVRKIYKGQVTTLLGDSPDNIPPGENPLKEPDFKEPERKSGALRSSTTFFPSILKTYQDRYLFLYEYSSTNRFIDLKKNIILGVTDTFGSGQLSQNEDIPPELKYGEYGEVDAIVFDQNGGVWLDSNYPLYGLHYYTVAGDQKMVLGENQSTLVDGFTGYRWSAGQKDGDFENFSFRSPENVVMGSNPNYLFVSDSDHLTTLRLVDLEKKQVSTVPGVTGFWEVFISPDDEMYIVRGRAIYRVEPSPVKVLTLGEKS